MYLTKSVLHPGQQLHVHACRGMTIVALQGEVLLHTPATQISEQIVRNTFVLPEGQAHVLVDGGWIAIRARTRAEIACVDSTSQNGSRFKRFLMTLSSAMGLLRPARGALRDS